MRNSKMNYIKAVIFPWNTLKPKKYFFLNFQPGLLPYSFLENFGKHKPNKAKCYNIFEENPPRKFCRLIS